jgi:uncharacterized protein with HEPN domain
MSRDREYLLDMLMAARLAIQYVEGRTAEQFLADGQLQDSVIRRLEILGEAARRVSEQARTQWPDLPWHSMTAMRNLLVHEYGEVDPAVVWDTVQHDLPALITTLMAIFQPEDRA